MLKALQSTLTAKNNIQYRYELTKLKHIWLYVKKHHYTGMSIGCPYRWSLTSGFSNSVEENSTGLALHEQRPVLPTISLKPELAKDLMWRVLRFAMVGSCELKIYCNWGKFRWQYERLKEVLYKLLFSRGFYFREFREWTSKREFNNARKYSHINLQHYEIILSTNTHGEQMQQHTAHASHTCTTSSTYWLLSMSTTRPPRPARPCLELAPFQFPRCVDSTFS